jgi:hypothetical protein
VLVGVEAGIDRVDRDQRSEHRRAGPGGDQVADGHFQLADAAGDRRAHFGVAQVETRRGQGRLRRAQVRVCFPFAVDALVELALGDRVLRPQPLRPLAFAFRIGEASLRRDDLRLRALHLGGVRSRVDAHQQLARAYERAFREVHRFHLAGDARAHVDALHRLEAPGELLPGSHLARHDGRHGHRHRLRLHRRRFGFRAGGAQVERAAGEHAEGGERRCDHWNTFHARNLLSGDRMCGGRDGGVTLRRRSGYRRNPFGNARETDRRQSSVQP